tara:strand:- start:1421 stop:1678 length:258 start_codon:yes stop_codon:yes gene_type:complete
MIKYFKRLWDALWARTTIDEKAEAALNETKSRLKTMKRELVDVKNAFKNVANQSKDVFDAAKGNKRRGRKPYKKSKKTNNNLKKN